MSQRIRYSKEVKDRAVLMVRDQQDEYGSQWQAICSIAAKIGCTCETLPPLGEASRAGPGVTPRADYIRS